VAMAAFFSARSTSGLSRLAALRAAGLHQPSDKLRCSHPSGGGPIRRDDDESLSAGRLGRNVALNASAKVRTDTAGSSPEYPSSPVYAGRSIKPAAGACSLGQGAFPNRSNRFLLSVS